jgi:small-conductance mechanosensitive channel
MAGNSWLESMSFVTTIPMYFVVALGVASGILLVRLLEKRFISRWKKNAAQSSGTFDDILVEVVDRALVPLIYYGVFAVGLAYLELPEWVGRTVKFVGLALVAFYGARVATTVIAHAVNRRSAAVSNDVQRMRVVVPILQVAIWGMALVFLLDNLGVQVSAVITGLGIGGIAVALAAQAILGDLFSYVAIVFDRPFSIGDFIVVDSFMGTVEHIGIKTTRVRSQSGELMVFPNSNLTSARVRNFQSLYRRRVTFTFGVSAQTRSELLEQIPQTVREILGGVADVTLDRVHLVAFGPGSLDFEVVYFVEGPDYHLYVDRQQAINLQLLRRFSQMGIELAGAARATTPTAPVLPGPPGPPPPPAEPARGPTS